MNDGTIGFGIDINSSGLATHLVTITCDDGREFEFKATCMKDDDEDEESLPTLYKVDRGEKDYDTYVEIDEENETVTISVEDEYIIADIIDSDIDGADMSFDCEEDGVEIHIEAKFILGENSDDIADVIHTTSFGFDDEEEDENDCMDGLEDFYPNRKKECTFCGLKIDGEVNNFVKLLLQKGYKKAYDERCDGYQTFKGKFYGYQCTIDIKVDENSNVKGVDVIIDDKNRNINSTLQTFNAINSIIEKEYGAHNNCNEDPNLIAPKKLLRRMIDDLDNFYYEFDFYKGKNLMNNITIWLMTDPYDLPYVSIDYHRYDDFVENAEDEHSEDENIDDDFEIRKNPCRFLGIEFGSYKTYCDELGNKGFQLKSKDNSMATFEGWFMNRKCEVTVFSNEEIGKVKYVDVDFSCTKDGRKLIKFYKELTNKFVEEYGEYSNSEDNPSDFDPDEIIDAVNSSQFDFSTGFDFFNHSYKLLNTLEITIFGTIDDNGDDAAKIVINYSDCQNVSGNVNDENVNIEDKDDNIDLKFAEEHPYLNYLSLVDVMANQDLFDKTHNAITNIIDFFEKNCFKEDFTDLIEQIRPNDVDLEQFLKAILMGDALSCITSIGGKLDMKTSHCVIVPMFSFRLNNNMDLVSGVQLTAIDNKMLKSLQKIADSIMESRSAINNYETFIISDLFSYYNKEKQIEYIDLMIRLCKCLMEYENPDPNTSKAFIQHLYQIQKINKGILVDK